MNTITKVDLTKEEIVITFESDKKKIIKSHAECCSKSYFKEFDTSRLIGKKIFDIIKKKKPVSIFEETIFEKFLDEFDEEQEITKEITLKTYQLTFLLNDDEYLLVYLVNESNGYYDGYITIEDK